MTPKIIEVDEVSSLPWACFIDETPEQVTARYQARYDEIPAEIFRWQTTNPNGSPQIWLAYEVPVLKG